MLKQTECHWHLGAVSDVSDSAYCRKKVDYRTVIDDDGSRKREYNAFCPKHMTEANKEDQNES